MDTILPLPFLPSVDLTKGATEAKEGLTRVQLSYLGCVHFTATDATIDTLLQFLQRHTSIESYVDVSAITSEEDIVTILDAGARKVFIGSNQFKGLSEYGDRMIERLSGDVFPDEKTYHNGILIPSDQGLDQVKAVLEILASKKISPIYLSASLKDLQSSSFVDLAKTFSVVPVIPATDLTIDADSKDKISVPSFVGALWTSDRADKLIPTVVTDERGIALGLVYSSQESLAESLKTGNGVYQSRKRGLWYKGATSGDTQELVRISLDCDQDCLKFVVRQKGRGR